MAAAFPAFLGFIRLPDVSSHTLQNEQEQIGKIDGMAVEGGQETGFFCPETLRKRSLCSDRGAISFFKAHNLYEIFVDVLVQTVKKL